MYSRYEPSKSAKSLQRSATESGHKRPIRTPSTQVSRLRKRETMDKKKKDDLNNNRKASNGIPSFFQEGTQTDFSPMPPLTPVSITEDANVDTMSNSLPQSPEQERYDTPVMPFLKEVTRSDIKLEEFNMAEEDEEAEEEDYQDDIHAMYNKGDPNFQYQTNIEEDITAAV